MTLNDKVYAVLSADAGVTVICPASRVKPYGSQQGLTLPYIVHGGSLEDTAQTHDLGLANSKGWHYKVSCFAANFSGAQNLAAAVIVALGSYRGGGVVSHLVGQTQMPYEADVRVQQIVLEFEIWESL